MRAPARRKPGALCPVCPLAVRVLLLLLPLVLALHVFADQFRLPCLLGLALVGLRAAAPTLAAVEDDANAVPAVRPTPLAAMPRARTAGANRFTTKNFTGFPFVGTRRPAFFAASRRTSGVPRAHCYTARATVVYRPERALRPICTYGRNRVAVKCSDLAIRP